MRVVRVRYAEQTFYAALYPEHVCPLGERIEAPQSIPLQEVALERLVQPTKVVCVGLNYHAHAQELGKDIPAEPLLFLKPPSSVIASGEMIRLPSQSENVHYEGELAMIMGKTCRNAEVEEVPEHIFGYSCANDVTARDLQQKDVQYTRAKGFDTFCPIGPCIETDLNPEQGLELRTLQNDAVQQRGSTSDMVFPPARLVSFISGIMTLNPGDVILTGTPPGVGRITSGDSLRIEIEGIGELQNSVQNQG